MLHIWEEISHHLSWADRKGSFAYPPEKVYLEKASTNGGISTSN
jgi:hypothetical protein